jgi:hypothetical protein
MDTHHGAAKRLFAVGAYTVLGDIMYIEVLVDEHDEKARYYRLTTLGDAGYLRGTWQIDTVPDVVLNLVELLISLGSEVRDGTVYGPHLSRPNSTCGLRNIYDDLHGGAIVKFDLHVDEEIGEELVWLERFLH